VEIPEQVTHVPRDGTLRLLYLGRLHPIKGIENLLAACKQLNDNAGIAWSLTVAGTGKPEYSEALKTRTCKLGLNQQVKIVGEVLGRTKRGLFENADIMVVPSYAESFGMVVAEALAQGIPVIASTGTPWRRLEEIGCGFWASNDPESLADAIQRMSKMPLRDMGRKGREWMAKEFAWPSVAAQMMQTYCRLMARSA
jgi:glycosyltransferase involved in cell wall biosynthesis